MKHRHFDWIILFLALAVMIYSGSQLFFSSSYRRQSSDEAIAHLEQTESDVRRRSQHDLAWGEARPGDSLEENDWVYVHQNSRASLFYLSGMKTNLSSATLVKLEGQKDAPVLILNKGEVSTSFSDTASTLKIKVGEKTLEIKSNGGQIDLSKNDKEIDVKVISGEATLVNQDGEREKLKTLDKLNLNLTTGQTKKTQMELGIEAPLPGSTFWAPSFPLIQKLSWVGEADVSFNNEKYDGQNQFWMVEVEHPGKYNWVLKSLKDEKEIIHTDLTFKKISAPQIITPFENQIFIPTASTMEVEVSWLQENEELLTHDIEIKEREIITTVGNKKTILIPVGDHQIRLRAEKNKTKGDWSVWRSFSLSVPPLLELNQFSPEREDYEVDFYTDKNVNDFSIDFSWEWKGVAGQMKFREVDQNDHERVQIISETSLKWSMKNFGEFQLHFTPYDQWGRENSFIKKINVILNDRRADILSSDYSIVKIELKRPDQLVKFEWEDAEEVAFVLAKDPGFKEKIIEKNVKNGKTQMTIPETGEFFWQTKRLDGEKRYSKPVKVEIFPSPPPEKPLIEKEIKLKIQKKLETNFLQKIFDLLIPSAMADEEFVKISWPVKEDVKHYLLEIAKDVNGEKVILEKKMDTAYFHWFGALPGIYYWRLSYQDYWGRQGPWSEYSKLIVEGDGEIELISPGNLSDIEKLPLELKWKKALGSRNYEWAIKKDKKVVLKGTTKQTFAEVDGPLDPGKYKWSVTSENAKSKERSFDFVSKQLNVPNDVIEDVRLLNFASVYLAPNLVQLSADNTSSKIEAKGMTLNSVAFIGSHSSWRYEFLRSHGKYSTGGTWDELKLHVRKGYHAKKWSLLADLQAMQLSYLSHVNGQYSMQKSSLLAIGPWFEWRLTPHWTFEFGSNVGQVMSYGPRIMWRSVNGPSVGISTFKHTFKNNGNSVSFSEQQLYFGWSHAY